MKLCAGFLTCLLAMSAPYAEAYEIAAGKVSWLAVGKPGFLKITGEGGKLQGRAEAGADGKVSGTFTVKLADYTTGMDLRDKHMKEKYLEVAKHPEASVTVTGWTPTVAESPFVGTLTLKGETKPVRDGKASLREGKLHAAFHVLLSDYPAVGVPSHLGITVAEDVTVEVEADVK